LPSRPRPRAVLPSSFTAMRHAGRRKFYAEALTRRGLRVIAAEYPGYGPRDGPVGEQNLVADAEETIAFAFASGTVAASALR